jgi:DNA gyrase subunit B
MMKKIWNATAETTPVILPYKGLGEMDAEQLWETTLDPERRVLKRVEIEDARMASEVTEMLMGSEVGPRRQFIYEHADEAEIDA